MIPIHMATAVATHDSSSDYTNNNDDILSKRRLLGLESRSRESPSWREIKRKKREKNGQP